MFIDYKNNFIFIRPPKCATTSIFSELWKKNNYKFEFKNMNYGSSVAGKMHSPDMSFSRKHHHNIHPTASEVKKLFRNEECFKSFDIIASIRNPYDHALSWYLFQKAMVDRRKKQKNDFRFFLNNPLRWSAQKFFSIHQKWNFKIFLRYFYKPYTDWFYINGANIVDTYLRVENLNEDFPSFVQKYNLDIENLGFKNKNNSSNSEIKAKLYDNQSKRIIKKKYGSFIELVGYKFE